MEANPILSNNEEIQLLENQENKRKESVESDNNSNNVPI